MTASKIFDINVSHFRNFFTEPSNITLGMALQTIKGDSLKPLIQELRDLYETDKEEYRNRKCKLPCITFSATFNKERNRQNLDIYNDLIILDIDKIDSKEVENIRLIFNDDPYVYSYWKSPSGHGFKAIILLDYQFDILAHGIEKSHKIAFNQLFDYFSCTYNITLDKSGSDFTRLCFYSWDPELVINSESLRFKINHKHDEDSGDVKIRHYKNELSKCNKALSKNLLENPLGKNKQAQRKQIEKIIRFLQKNNLSITHTYSEWLIVGFAIADSFTFAVGLKYYQNLSKLDSELYQEDECRRMLQNCFQYSSGNVHFSTVEFLAKQKGFPQMKLEAQSTYAADN